MDSFNFGNSLCHAACPSLAFRSHRIPLPSIRWHRWLLPLDFGVGGAGKPTDTGISRGPHRTPADVICLRSLLATGRPKHNDADRDQLKRSKDGRVAAVPKSVQRSSSRILVGRSVVRGGLMRADRGLLERRRRRNGRENEKRNWVLLCLSPERSFGLRIVSVVKKHPEKEEYAKEKEQLEIAAN